MELMHAVWTVGAVRGLVFESPVLGPFVVGVAALVAMVVLRSMGRARAASAALAVGVVLAVGAGVLSRAVETPRESIVRQTRELVEAGASGDASRVESLLGPRVVISAGGVSGGDGGTLVSAVERYGDRVASARLVVNESVIDSSTTGRVLARVNLTMTGGQPVSTEWWFTWQRVRADGPFVLTALDATMLWNRPADASVVRALQTGR